MLLDVNVLLYAVASDSPHHERARDWLNGSLEGERRVAQPWQTIGAFLRLSTNPRIVTTTVDARAAWAIVQGWLDRPTVWIPPVGERTAAILGELVVRYQLTANQVPDALLAAQAIEHGIALASADRGFARFEELSWINPLKES